MFAVSSPLCFVCMTDVDIFFNAIIYCPRVVNLPTRVFTQPGENETRDTVCFREERAICAP